MGPQMPLSVQLPDTASFDNFYAGPNAEAAAAVQRLAHGAERAPVLLHGPDGSGKTHLLQAAIRVAAKRGAVAYLPLAALQPATPALLEGLDQAALLALDDIDLCCSDRDFALALLRLLDTLRMRNGSYLLASTLSADRIVDTVPADLRTRFSACAQFSLKPLDDAELGTLLQTRARHRGLELPNEVVEFLLRRLPRRIPTLMDALETLDHAALSAQRRLTVPFVTQALPALAPPAARTTPG
ncbi:MAG: hda [Nevskia sp.]|nr:hda [Nevskia sp.]